MAFFVDSAVFFQNDRRYVAVRYGALKNSDKFALPFVLGRTMVKGGLKAMGGKAFWLRFGPKSVMGTVCEIKNRDFSVITEIKFSKKNEIYREKKQKIPRISNKN
jgi:hypothetical protein